MSAMSFILDLQKRKRDEEARRRALGLIALESANPTDAEAQGFVPGVPIEGMAGTTGASPTDDPAGARLDLLRQLRNEELQRAAQQGGPALAAFRRNLAFQDAGLNENTVAEARTQNIQADDQAQRNAVTGAVLTNPDADPLLKIDVANKRDVFKSSLVKVKRKDGAEVFMHATPTLSGQTTYAPALDEDGAPLRAPVSATSSRGYAPGQVQKNVEWISKSVAPFREMTDRNAAIDGAFRHFNETKVKSPREAYASIASAIAKENFGALSPETLKQKTNERWYIYRQGEPLPQMPPDAASAPTVPPRHGTPAKTPAAPPRAGGFPNVQNDADFLKLPSGARFIDPNGQLRRKP